MSKNFTVVMKNVGNVLMNNIQMGLFYEQWSDEFSYDEIKERYAKVKEELKGIIGDVTALSVDELKELGFKKWDEESNLFLIPLWVFDLIPDGTELESISGGKAIKGLVDIDLDVRFGCIAWGLQK
jgi:hypothetical protein